MDRCFSVLRAFMLLEASRFSMYQSVGSRWPCLKSQNSIGACSDIRVCEDIAVVMCIVFVIMPMYARYAMQRTPLILEEYSGLWHLSSVYGLSLSQYGAPHAIPGHSWATTVVHESLLVGALLVHGWDGLVRRIQLREILQKNQCLALVRTTH